MNTLEKDNTTMMMMTSINGYNLPALPANYGAKPAIANPEYASAWQTAATVPTTTTAYGYTAPSTTNNSASQANYAQNNNSLAQYDGRSYSPTYTDNSKVDNSKLAYAYNPSTTSNSASQYNNTKNTVNNEQNNFDGRTFTDNSKYAYVPTTNNTDNSQKTATQNTNTDIRQYLNQTDNRQLNQNYTQNTENNTANINNNFLAYYNPINNRVEYKFPPVPQQPPVVVPPTPEAPKQGGGEFPWWLVIGGVLGVGALTNGFGLFNKPAEKKVETPATPSTPTEGVDKPKKTKVTETSKKICDNEYKMDGDPFCSINGGKRVQHLAGIHEKGGTASVHLGTTDEGTQIDSTYVRSHVNGKHGAMESMQALSFKFADGKAISVKTGKEGTTLNIGGKAYDISHNQTIETGHQTVKIEGDRAVITSSDSTESFTVYLGKYTSAENIKKLGPNFLQLNARVSDFTDGVFDEMEGKAGHLKPASGGTITTESETILADESSNVG
jgi:hypothetical protein